MATDPTARFTSTALFAQALGSEILATPTDTATLPQAAVSAAKSVAVLPFANMSADAADYARRALAINPDDPLLLYNISCMYAMLGNPDEALSCLEKAVDKGYGQKDWVEHDSDLDSLRQLPRFQTIVAAM